MKTPSASTNIGLTLFGEQALAVCLQRIMKRNQWKTNSTSLSCTMLDRETKVWFYHFNTQSESETWDKSYARLCQNPQENSVFYLDHSS